MEGISDTFIPELKKLLPVFEIQIELDYKAEKRDLSGRFSKEWHWDFSKPPIGYNLRFSIKHPYYGKCTGILKISNDLISNMPTDALVKYIAEQITMSYKYKIKERELNP